jgi:cation transport ATPase
VFFIGKNPHLFLEGASFIVTFILLGKYLETKSKKHAGNAIAKLLELQEKRARVMENGEEVYKDVVQVKK